MCFGEWQPIESAPRGNGVEFIGWDGSRIEKTWKGWGDDRCPAYAYSDWMLWEPTHWMPLPPAPTNEG